MYSIMMMGHVLVIPSVQN